MKTYTNTLHAGAPEAQQGLGHSPQGCKAQGSHTHQDTLEQQDQEKKLERPSKGTGRPVNWRLLDTAVSLD
jgi:hypothetical protein